MKTTSYYPVLMVDEVAPIAAFYVEHFGFRPLFESDWYVHLQSAEDEAVNLAILQGDHETIKRNLNDTIRVLRASARRVPDESGRVESVAGRAGAGAGGVVRPGVSSRKSAVN